MPEKVNKSYELHSTGIEEIKKQRNSRIVQSVRAKSA